MFCEKCGAAMPDDSAFCEKCGARVQPIAAGRGSIQRQDSLGSKFTKLLGLYFKAPSEAMKACSQNDYSIPGILFLSGKSLILAILLTMFRDDIIYSVPGLGWMYVLLKPTVFIVAFLFLLIMDAVWIGLLIGVSQILTNGFHIKSIVGSAGTGSLYTIAFAVIGVLLSTVFGLNGMYIGMLPGVAFTAVLQYEGIAGILNNKKREAIVYGMLVIMMVFAILWVLIGTGAAVIVQGYDYY